MSRVYRVNWAAGEGSIIVCDELELPLRLLDVLPGGGVQALLRQELQQDGWAQEADGSMTKQDSGVQLRLAPDASKVTARVERKAELAKTVVAESQEEADQLAEEDKARRIETQEEYARKALLRVEPELRVKLNDVLQRVYIEALKRRAAQMGTIESVTEGRDAQGEYELTIRVKA